MKLKLKKKLSIRAKICLIWVGILGLAVGNRIFNHMEAWSGLLVMILCTIYIIYLVIKLFNDEKRN